MKNKTLNDLEKLPDKPYDLPSYSNSREESKKLNDDKNNKNIKKSHNSTNTKINTLSTPFSSNKIKDDSLFDKINSKENYRFLSKLSNDNGYHFDLLKFKQNNYDDKIEINKNNINFNFNAKLNKKIKKENEKKDNPISIFDVIDKDNENYNENIKKNSQIKFKLNQNKIKKNENLNLTNYNNIIDEKKDNINNSTSTSNYINKEIENSLVEKFSKNLKMKMGYDIFKTDILKKEINISKLYK